MGLTRAWNEMKFHSEQNEVWRTDYRFKVLACGRGSGKSDLARKFIVRLMPVKKAWPDPIYFYAMPTYNQARRVAWVKILDLIPKDWIEEKNVHNLFIKTKFGSTLYVAGMDNPARIEGSQYDGGIIDESSDIRPGVFDRSILPALSHRNGFCWRIGVPKRFGVGAIEYKRFFDKGLVPNSEGIKSWNWPSEGIVPPEELENAKKILTETDFAEQYRASWESVGGRVFYAYSRNLNVTEHAEYDPRMPILVGSDFNVSPMCWCLAHKYGNKLVVFDEIVLKNTNTVATLTHLHKAYEGHSKGWEFYGDAAGRQRKTSAVSTDYMQIRNDPRFDEPKKKKIFYPMKNPVVLNRIQSCNAVLKNAKGEVRCLINPRCKALIEDLEGVAYKEGTREIEEVLDLGHMSDAWGYLVYKLFPYRGNLLGADVHGKVIIQ